VEKKKAEGWTLDGGAYGVLDVQYLTDEEFPAYGADPPETKYGFEDEVCSFIGFKRERHFNWYPIY